MERDNWSSRSTFILAAVGSAVGLGNAWRFPGLAAKHGGGAFLLVYLIALFLLGIPLLAMEISMGRRIHQGVPGTLRTINKKAEHIGWIAVSNGLFISVYYAVVFAWVILMFFLSYKFAGFTEAEDGIAQASSLWLTTIKTTGTTSGYGTISLPVLGCLILAWGSCYYCIRNGSASVGKVVRYTVSLPVLCLLILAIRGFTMPGAGEGLAKLFIPDWSALSDSTLWVDAIGQVFYSLSVAMAIMFAYGSYLDSRSNVAVDTIIIAVSDMLISVLAAIVMFSTMAGTGMLDNMTASGISTAFIVYPQAIVNLTKIPVVNAIFALVFYFCLITLAIDSLFSIVEGTTTAISDKFKLPKKKTTIIMCIIEFFIGIFFCTGAGLAWLDIVDNFINSYTLVLTGILEAIAVGWFFKTSKVLDEINKNTSNFKMPTVWFYPSIKVITPVVLSILFIWNIVSLFKNGGIYGANDGYSLASNIIGGWLIIALSIFSGLIVKLIVFRLKKKGFKEDDRNWDFFKN
ncbi:MAG: sodium-dependent transporter [Lachnospiraceae bacterium]|nr:sodium-dependent transporter [Lachnospiraceae bacterium]